MEEEVKEKRKHQNDRNEELDVLDVVNSIEKRLPASVGCLRVERPCTIYRVPKQLRQANEKCYEPQLFSIGPYHHGKEGLKPMEEAKFQHLLAILSRNPKTELKDYVKEIKALEAQARECYSENVSMERKEFVKMMVVDGCFLVEMFLRVHAERVQYDLWLPFFISHDMLLLENQLPFFILKCIFCLAMPEQDAATSMEKLPLECFKFVHIIPLNDGAEAKESYYHLLDFCHHHCLPTLPHPIKNVEADSSSSSSSKKQWLPKPHKLDIEAQSDTVFPDLRIKLMKANPKDKSPNKPAPPSIRTAEELQEAGIEFKRKKEKEGSFLDIKFKKKELKGIIKMLSFFFSDNLHSVFQNLIAFEQCNPEVRTCFTGYAFFMDNIINTAKDIKILRHSGVLEHGLGSDEELARLFNQMNRGVFYHAQKTHLNRELKAINEFCEARWHTWRAILMRNYFNSPWAILSFAAAVLFLLLTITQTIFCIYPYV